MEKRTVSDFWAGLDQWFATHGPQFKPSPPSEPPAVPEPPAGAELTEERDGQWVYLGLDDEGGVWVRPDA
jgi:hypothetical protein